MSHFDFEQADTIGHIGALWVFPIKSCAGMAVTEAKLLPTGLEWDRAWMVVDAQGRFITQREVPQMALVQPHVDEAAGVLRIHHGHQNPLEVPLALPFMQLQPQMPVQVWNSRVMAWDLGEPAAQWFSQALGRVCRLVRFDPAQQRLSNTKWTGGLLAPNQFADGYPLLITTSAAVQALNEKLAAQGHAAVQAVRFRANIVVDGWSEHEEDFVQTAWVQSDAPVAIQMAKPCSRCSIPNIDPLTAQSSPAVGDALHGYRQDARLQGAITFGMNAVVAQGAGEILRVGQVVGGQLKFA